MAATGIILRAPVSRRTWAEILYIIVNTPLAVLGFVYALVPIVLGVGLAVTAAGFPLLALGLYGARGFGAFHRKLAGGLLGERVEPPPRARTGSGFYGKIQARLGDATAWRAMAYLLLKLPLTVISFYVMGLTWAWGFVAFTHPLQRALGLNTETVRGADGRTRHGLQLFGIVFDSPLREVVLCVSGALLLLLAPWATHLATLPERGLTRWLLGPAGWPTAYATWRRPGRARSTTPPRPCAASNATCTTARRSG